MSAGYDAALGCMEVFYIKNGVENVKCAWHLYFIVTLLNLTSIENLTNNTNR